MSPPLPARLAGLLRRSDGQEDLCFLLWRPSTGRTRTTAVIFDVVLPEIGDRDVHGNAAFHDHYFLRAAARAAEADAGLGLVHSHPRGRGWQNLSRDDHAAEAGHAAQTTVLTGLPLLGLTYAGHDDQYSARLWERNTGCTHAPRWCDNVRVVGTRIQTSWNPTTRPAPDTAASQIRTVSAWGPRVQADLARLRIGVAGTGSVGYLVAEALARMGIEHLTLIDFDIVEILNLDRLLYATRRDALAHRRKIDVLTEGVRRSATADAFQVDAYPWSVVEPAGLAEMLDCDVIFSCVDRPWPRAVLNLVAYAHLIPVIDGGIRTQTTPSPTMRGADWRSHLVAPGRPCMECLGQYSPSDVALERTGLLDDPTYITGLDPDHTVRHNENVFPFSMAAAAAEVMELIRAVAAPSGIADVGASLHHFTTATIDRRTDGCDPNCLYSGMLLATADHHGLQVTGEHHAANAAREQHARHHPSPKPRRIIDAVARRLRRRPPG